MKKNFFKNMPSALRSEQDIKTEQINKGIKGLFAAAIITVAGALATSFYLNSEDQPSDDTKEQTINTSPSPD